MNTPNKLTIIRIIIVPFIIAATLINFPFHFIVAGLLFGAASITDMLDGRIARKNNIVTDFGKFADPLADKILVISSFICFLKIGLPIAIPIIIVLFREFMVTSIRLVAASKGQVIAANIWGKVKTISQIVAVLIYYLLFGIYDILNFYVILPDETQLFIIINIICILVVWISTIFTIISGVKYIIDNKYIINEK